MALNVIQGYNPSTTEPIDSRFIVANQSARFALPSFNIYEGLVVYQQDNNTLYVLVDPANVGNASGWSTVGAGAGVSQIVAGTNVTISPVGGTGVVTINAAGGGGGVTSIIAGTGISIDQSTGDVTITATGGGGGPSTFACKVSQESNNDPNMTILRDDFGGVFTFTRITIGSYLFQDPLGNGYLRENETSLIISPGFTIGTYVSPNDCAVWYEWQDIDSFRVYTTLGKVLSDDVLQHATLEIKKY